jgi:hypothetical protein
MTTPPNPAPASPGRGGALSVLRWVLCVFLVYLLASGPIARLSVAGYLPMGAVDNLYQPLLIIAPEGSPQRKALEWYVFELWQVPLPPIK